MLFTSGAFIFIYLPLTVITFFILARVVGMTTAAVWLTVMSIVFYGYWAPVYVLLLLASITMNYIGGRLIHGARGRPHAKLLTGLFISFNLALLSYFKYYNFFVESLQSLSVHLPVYNVILPIGVSFFTFTQIAYLADAYKGKVNQFNVIHYVLFVTYFPHLIAGPVLHHKEMTPQFADVRNYAPQARNLVLGAAWLLMGLMKKVLVADSVSPIADKAFSGVGSGFLDAAHAWEGVIAYTLQLYFDFSGYSDMAIGISLLLNIHLPLNFNSPYKACSIIDFWRRWHLTLSRFLRDYLYIPLGGSRLGAWRRYVNLFVTMLLGGMWHGAAWTFIIWGGLHGVYLIINHGWRWLGEKAQWSFGERRFGRAFGRASGWALTMAAVILGWVFFRAASVGDALTMLSVMTGLAGPATLAAGAAPAWSAPMSWPELTVIAAVAVFLPNSSEIASRWIEPRIDAALARPLGQDYAAAALGSLCSLIIATALIAASRTESVFIYSNF
jgi:alginate O-acetyltransferase complex protein AlgI